MPGKNERCGRKFINEVKWMSCLAPLYGIFCDSDAVRLLCDAPMSRCLRVCTIINLPAFYGSIADPVICVSQDLSLFVPSSSSSYRPYVRRIKIPNTARLIENDYFKFVFVICLIVVRGVNRKFQNLTNLTHAHFPYSINNR